MHGVNAACQMGTAQTDKPDELAAGPDLDGPQAVAVSRNPFHAAIHQLVGLAGGEQCREVLHHQGVCIQLGEWRPVGPAPLSEHESRRARLDQPGGRHGEATGARGGRRVDTGQVSGARQTGEAAGSPVCVMCGRSPENESAARLTWARGVEHGRPVWTCERCSREHLRGIEGKLDSPWW